MQTPADPTSRSPPLRLFQLFGVNQFNVLARETASVPDVGILRKLSPQSEPYCEVFRSWPLAIETNILLPETSNAGPAPPPQMPPSIPLGVVMKDWAGSCCSVVGLK